MRGGREKKCQILIIFLVVWRGGDKPSAKKQIPSVDFVSTPTDDPNENHCF